MNQADSSPEIPTIPPGRAETTAVARRAYEGDADALAKLVGLTYEELRRVASAMLKRERRDHTLQPTALVHEAYVRLVDVEHAQHWDSRGHFFSAAAEAMRRILVERARKRRRREAKQGPRISLATLSLDGEFPSEELLHLDEALCELELRDAVASQIVKLRFFAGLTMREAAEALGLTMRTAERNWTYARSWLHGRLAENDGDCNP